MTTSETLLHWIRIAQSRTNIELAKTLWFARDMIDGITALDDPEYSEQMKTKITEAFNAMNQDNEDLLKIRKELSL